ncbi:hypothetical protein ZEAMMB73_Zm00001d023890 [Zea mays]|uniref:Uncharacterized protein n=1 Tax=Zea mays TaxID=4577 RepID=A0A1D6IWN3_MAIZE|nr:hypothetical protein ZEAMMB73_Zm00001d023890 [Zea mays]
MAELPPLLLLALAPCFQPAFPPASSFLCCLQPPAAMAELLFSPAVPLRAGSTKASAPFIPWRAWSRPLRPAPLRPPAPVLGVLLPPPADLHLPAPWPPSSSSSTPHLCPAFFPMEAEPPAPSRDAQKLQQQPLLQPRHGLRLGVLPACVMLRSAHGAC